MKSTPLVVGLFLLVVGFGFWTAHLESKISESDSKIDAMKTQLTGSIVALKNQLTAATANAPTATVQKLKSGIQLVTTPTPPVADSPDGPNNSTLNLRAGLAAALALPPGDDRNAALYKAASALASVDPQAAWDAAQKIADDQVGTRNHTLRNILKTLSASDPAKAATLLSQAPLPETSIDPNNTTGSIMGSWVMQDPQAASQWANTLPAGNTRDSAVVALVSAVVENDPKSAVAWADTMADPTIRGTLIQNIVSEWAKTDAAGATQALLDRKTGQDTLQIKLDMVKQIAAKAAEATVPSAASGP
ncbi:MAG TPA: hypothetical protein VK737_06270 [Opitutales bacterium]|jgi:hypothetical protein|nr:hypothetical protein [Opitutales bacterium]